MCVCVHTSIVCTYITLLDLFYSWFSYRSNNFYLYQRVNCIESYIHTTIQYQIINANVSKKIIEYLCCILNLFQQFIDSLTSNRARCLLSICDNNDRMHINNSNIVHTREYCLPHKTDDKKGLSVCWCQLHIKILCLGFVCQDVKDY